jgi:aromatic-L-amino-acid/L-tryptophan decarboxylase
MSDKLALPSDEFADLARQGAEFVAQYYESLAERPVFVPTTAVAMREALDEPLPAAGADFAGLLDVIRDVVARYNRHSAHPRLFGYVCSPGAPVTTISRMIAAALNVNVTCWRSAPSGTQMELTVIRWMKEILGYPAEAAGVLVSGGSMANFAGLAAARSAKAPANVMRDGLSGAPPMCAYVSREGHFSVTKAAGMLGLGEANVRQIATDASMRIDLADFARRENLWLHVDAAYGGFAALAPSTRDLFARIGEADSVALDPHKWLYGPMGCGCVLYKDPATARAAFSHDADYIRRVGLMDDEAFAFWDYGPELSRPFRALDLWMLIKFAGAQQIADAIERNMACAQYFEKLVRASDDFEMLAPVGLSIFCFRYRPPGFTGDFNALNEGLMVDLQRAGSSYVSNTTIGGQFALRGCVLNYRTTERDMERLLEDARTAGEGYAKKLPMVRNFS